MAALDSYAIRANTAQSLHSLVSDVELAHLVIQKGHEYLQSTYTLKS
jgi:hypothetical protein